MIYLFKNMFVGRRRTRWNHTLWTFCSFQYRWNIVLGTAKLTIALPRRLHRIASCRRIRLRHSTKFQFKGRHFEVDVSTYEFRALLKYSTLQSWFEIICNCYCFRFNRCLPSISSKSSVSFTFWFLALCWIKARRRLLSVVWLFLKLNSNVSLRF